MVAHHPQRDPSVGARGVRTPDRSSTNLSGMGHRVESELVANVIAVHVTSDQVVAVGDELVLLESMKMEIPVLSERSGRILEVKVTAGDVVQEGEVLVVIDD